MGGLKLKFLMGPCDCNDPNIPSYSEDWLRALAREAGQEMEFAGMDEVAASPLPLYFIGSGGSERFFKQCYKATADRPYILVTTPAYNSLAAAMEILGFLRERGLEGEILHGSPASVAARLGVLRRAAEAFRGVRGKRIGCFGDCEGLVASAVDFAEAKASAGIEMESHDLGELIAECRKGGFPENRWTRELLGKGWDEAEVRRALDVYGALRRLVERHNLDAVTVKCFDLLGPLGTTGCLALAILNAEGIPATCEGDQKSAVSMLVLNEIAGRPGFIANPSEMDPEKGEIVFAHCTLPLDMPDSYSLATHFESGIGVAVAGDMAPRTMTVFKCDGTLDAWWAGRAALVETLHRSNLCRTQMRLRLEDGVGYFANGPLGNHHIICPGDHKAAIDRFFFLHQYARRRAAAEA